MVVNLWAEVILIIGLVILVAAVIAQYTINSSLVENLIELVERVESLEKTLGIGLETNEIKEEK